ncbi:hypothetical protein YSKK_26130 [Halopseudomonas aestusnigri]|nr:hypothetical protein YSKK_26130 [Halopseudomonas aestusnigri]
MMRSCGRNFQVASDVIFNSLSGISVGRNVYIAPGNVFICSELNVGNDVIFGPNSVFSGGNHQFDGASFRWLPSKSKGVIRIGSGSWVAANCCIVTGGALPERSVLAAGSVLNKDMLDDNSIYAGMPARKIGTVKCEAA